VNRRGRFHVYLIGLWASREKCSFELVEKVLDSENREGDMVTTSLLADRDRRRRNRSAFVIQRLRRSMQYVERACLGRLIGNSL
jgi:hypothetical protein